MSFPFIWWCWKNIPSTSIHNGWMRKCSKSYVKTENGETTREEKNKLKSWAMAWKIGNCKRCWNAFSGLIYIYCHCNAWWLFELDGLYSLLFVDLDLFDFLFEISAKNSNGHRNNSSINDNFTCDFGIRTLKCFNIKHLFNTQFNLFLQKGINLKTLSL